MAQEQCYQFVPTLNWIAFLGLLDHETDCLLVNREQVIVLQAEVEQDLTGLQDELSITRFRVVSCNQARLQGQLEQVAHFAVEVGFGGLVEVA